MTRIDGLIVLLAIALVTGLYLSLWQPRGDDGARAYVSVDGERVKTLDLRTDGSHIVEGRLGETRLVIAGGRIRVSASPGRRQICVRDGWLEEAGASVVCLPNRVVVEIAGDPEHGLDGITH